MGAHSIDEAAGSEGDAILESSYKRVPIPSITIKSACELLLKKAQENAACGRTKWLVITNY